MSSNTDHYPLKAYFYQLTQSTREQALAPGSAQGYVFDDGQNFNSKNSASFLKRCNYFKEGSDYTKNLVTFAGPFYSDLMSCEQGVSCIFPLSSHINH